jgi:polar amino acid transport system substrate-binding protein
MKRNVMAVTMVVLLLAMVLVINGCGKKVQTTEATPAATVNETKAPNTESTTSEGLLAKIKKNGKVVVGTEAAFAPFEFVKDGKIVGYGSDILDYIIKDLNVKLDQLDTPFQGILPGLDAGRFDFVATSVTITPKRAEQYLFTVPIADGTVAILKRKGDTSIKSPEDIAGKVVGVQLNSGPQNVLNIYNETLKAKGTGVKEIKEYVGYPEAYQDLATGRVDSVIQSMPNLAYLIKTRPDTFEIVGKIGDPTYMAWVVRKGDEDMQSYLSKKLLELRDSGKLQELQQKWFGFTMEIPDKGYLPKTK